MTVVDALAGAWRTQYAQARATVAEWEPAPCPPLVEFHADGCPDHIPYADELDQVPWFS